MNIPLNEAIILLIACCICAGAAWWSLRDDKTE